MNIAVKSMVFGLGALLAVSCSNTEETNNQEDSNQEELMSGTHAMNVESSSIKWNGYEVGEGPHSGLITFKSGELTFEEGIITGGSFIVDMNSIAVTDLGEEEEEEHEEEEHHEEGEEHEDEEGGMADEDKLANHLKAPDFFEAAEYPTSALTFTNVKNDGDKYEITADITIKGITKEVKFNATFTDGTFNATVKIDRTLFGIDYGLGGIMKEFDVEVEFKLA